MGKKASQQVTFSKGELDPDLSDRVDLEHYYDSLADALNCVFHPQGGVSDRGGSALISDADVLASGTKRRLRRRILPVYLTSGMVTAANGGTAANLVDQDPTTVFTTNANTADLFVVAEIDLGLALQVDLADVLDFSAELAPVDAALAVEYWNGSGWRVLADPLDTAPRKHIRTTARRRRFGTAPGGPGGVPVTARFWRITVAGGNGVTGTISIGGFRLWTETAHLGPIDVREIARDTADSYELVISERHVDVFERQRWLASLPLPIAGQQVREITHAGGFDTMLLFHDLLETQRIVRQGSGAEWNIGPLAYTDVPDLTAGMQISGSQDEIQDVSLPGLVAGDVLTLWLGDMNAGPFLVTSIAGLAAQMATALGGLPGVEAIGVVATLVDAAVPTVRVKLYGGTNGFRAWPLISGLTRDGVATTTTVVQAGRDAAGKAFGERTGWPACGWFVQNRLLVAGLRSAPSTFAFSRVGSFSFLDTTDPMTADLAFFRTLDVDVVENIRSCFVGRHIQLFTDRSEWYLGDHVLDATQPQPAIRASASGIRRGVPLAFSDGSSLFVQEGGKTLRDFLWNYNDQTYGAEPLTVLSPQIMKDVVDVAHRSARSVSEGNLVFMANSDGTAGCLTLLRGQNVVAGAPWTTDGKWKAFMSNVRHQVYSIVERGGEHWLELWQKDLPLDFATRVALGGGHTITGATHLAGRSDVWAYADDELLGPLTVTGAGVIELGQAASDVVYGLAPPWRARLQVLRDKLAQQQAPFRPPGRIYEVEFALKDTGALTIASNGGAGREVPLQYIGGVGRDAGPLATETGGASALPMLQRLFTGSLRVGGLTGFSRHPYLTLSRTVPAPVHLKALRLEFVMKD